MQSVFELLRMPVFKNKKAGKWSSEPIDPATFPPPERYTTTTSIIYSAAPPKVGAAFSKSTTKTYRYTFVQHPAKRVSHQTAPEANKPSLLERIVYKAVPALSAAIAICTLIGLYYMIITVAPPPAYFSRSLATPSQLSLPKKSPPQSDAFATEYQHAITTEWIAAADTVAVVAKLPNNRKAIKEAEASKVTVKANHFSASAKKGIRNLELKVTNGSAHMLEQIMLQVDFLNKNGDLLHTENYTARKVPAHGAKTIKVPSGTRGKKISYRIIEVKSHSYTTTLQHI